MISKTKEDDLNTKSEDEFSESLISLSDLEDEVPAKYVAASFP